MEKPKAPLKFKIKYTNIRKKNVHGTVIFHGQNYKFIVKPSDDKEIMKIPFNILGIMNENHLVRFSGITGTYTEYRPIIQNSVKEIEIESDEILKYMSKSKNKYDTIEIFVN